MKFRYYDPAVGRFINADDISYLDPQTINGLNLYSYCGNNPIRRKDTEGNFWIDVLQFGLTISYEYLGAISSLKNLITIANNIEHINKFGISKLKAASNLANNTVLGKITNSIGFIVLGVNTALDIYNNIQFGASQAYIAASAITTFGAGYLNMKISSLVGTFVGTLFINPILGLVVGVGLGVLVGLAINQLFNQYINGKTVSEWITYEIDQNVQWASNTIATTTVKAASGLTNFVKGWISFWGKIFG